LSKCTYEERPPAVDLLRSLHLLGVRVAMGEESASTDLRPDANKRGKGEERERRVGRGQERERGGRGEERGGRGEGEGRESKEKTEGRERGVSGARPKL